MNPGTRPVCPFVWVNPLVRSMTDDKKSHLPGKWLLVKTKCRSPSVSWTVQKLGVSYSISN